MIDPVMGVTGLPCAGKSLAAEILASGQVTGHPGVLVKADDLGHAVLVRPDVLELLRGRFGDAPFTDPEPAVIRARIARLVFTSPADLAWLETIVHPRVVAETEEIIRRERGVRPVIVEAALLFAAAMDRNCDLVLVVEADFATRLRRAAGRGWNREELERRDRRLLPLFESFDLERRGTKTLVVRNDADDGLLADRIGGVLPGTIFKK